MQQNIKIKKVKGNENDKEFKLFKKYYTEHFNKIAKAIEAQLGEADLENSQIKNKDYFVHGFAVLAAILALSFQFTSSTIQVLAEGQENQSQSIRKLPILALLEQMNIANKLTAFSVTNIELAKAMTDIGITLQKWLDAGAIQVAKERKAEEQKNENA
jgi:hypothetical protein